MMAVAISQPWASAIAEGKASAFRWPWPITRAAASQHVALYATVLWSPEQMQTARELGLGRCPRGALVGVARLIGWADRLDGVPTWRGEKRPDWADAEGLEARWPSTGGDRAAFFEDAVPTQSPVFVLDGLGRPRAPLERGVFEISASTVQRLRVEWRAARQAQRASAASQPQQRQPRSSAPPRVRPEPRPATPEAEALSAELRRLVPPAWAVVADDFTVAVRDDSNHTVRAYVRPMPIEQLIDDLVAAAKRARVDHTVIQYIRQAKERAHDSAH